MLEAIKRSERIHDEAFLPLLEQQYFDQWEPKARRTTTTPSLRRVSGHGIFTAEEQRILADCYWQDEQLSHQSRGYVACPSCRATVRIGLGEIGVLRVRRATCVGCGKRGKFLAAKERGRDFTEAELRQVADLYKRRATSRCPHDATPLHVDERRVIAGLLGYRFSCPRCGACGTLEQR